MNLVARVKGILLNPQQEWAVIDAEPFNQSAILTGYVLPLAVIGPIASFIGWTVFGLGFGIRLGVGTALTGAITAFVLAVVGVFVLAWVANALAPTFGAQQNFGQAFKLAAYCYTAAWVAGILAIFPALGIIGALVGGLYSLYLLYLGIPILMKSPADKTVTFMVALLVVLIVIYYVAGTITRRVMY